MKLTSTLCFVFCFAGVMARQREPQCSQFDFAERTLEKVIQFEHENKIRNEKFGEIEKNIKNKLDEMGRAVQDKLEEIERSLNSFNEFRDEMSKSWTDHKLEIDTKLATQKNELIQLKDQNKTTTILFKAKDATVSSLSHGDVIVFPTDVMNVGGAYNNKTGVFTAPVTGVYMFTTQFCIYSNKHVYLHIIAADKVISASMSQQDYGSTCYTYDGIAVLEQGDDVTVKVRSKSSGTIIQKDNSNNYYWTSFSGVLLHQ